MPRNSDTRPTSTLGLLLCGALSASALMLGACSETENVQPASLDGPRAMAIARGEVCLPGLDQEFATIPDAVLPACPAGERGAIGFIVNEQRQSVSVASMTGTRARLVNLDPSVPGVAQITVGRRPVDVATSGDGTAAFVANQLDRTITPISVWVLRPLDSAIELPGTPLRLATRAAGGDDDAEQLVAALASPSALWVRDTMRCEAPGGVTNRRRHTPDDDCEFVGARETTLALPGAIADMSVSPRGERAYVVYADRNDLSVVALSEAGRESGDGSELACLEGDAVPCEIARVELAGAGAAEWGYAGVSADPHGRLVYVVDRANNQILVVDATRLERIDAALATEPPAVPFGQGAGIAAVRLPLAVEGDISRRVLWSEGDRALIRYVHGAYVSSDTGFIHYVEAMNTYCEVEHGGTLVDPAQFYDDPAAVAASAEADCLTVPAFPLGGDDDGDGDGNGDGDDGGALAHRLFTTERARLAVNPTFALRDARAATGRLVGRASCVIPPEMADTVREELGTIAVSCGSPALPQPIAPDVDPGLSNFTDQPRAELLQLESLVMVPPESGAGEVELEVRSEPYDFRLRDETWTVTFEGVLPATARADRGLVDIDDGARFVAGIDLCEAGVLPGDRLTILTRPAADAPAGCAAYADSTLRDFVSYDVVDVSPGELELAVIEGTDAGRFVDVLPSRECFAQGLRFEVRPVGEWVVAGERSGYVSELRAEGGACVERPGAEFGRTSSRVRTGERFVGPFLEFVLREGAVEPATGMAYSFVVERNFTPERFETSAALPVALHVFRTLPGGQFLVAIDPNANLVSLRNLSVPDTEVRNLR